MLKIGGNVTRYPVSRVMAYIPMRSSNMDHDFLYSLVSHAEGDPSELRYKSTKPSIHCGSAQLVEIHEHRITLANCLMVWPRLVSSRRDHTHTSAAAAQVIKCFYMIYFPTHILLRPVSLARFRDMDHHLSRYAAGTVGRKRGTIPGAGGPAVH